MMQNKPPFITDANGSSSSSPKSSGMSMQERAPNRPTQMGDDSTLNPDSVPKGGKLPKADPTGTAGNSGSVSDTSGVTKKPFKLNATPSGEPLPSGNVGDV